MPRGKVKFELIGDVSKRRVAFKQRKTCIFKKAEELSILCGVDVCAIVYDGPSGPTPEVFSSSSDVPRLLSRFSNMSGKKADKNKTKRIALQQKEIAAKKAELEKIEIENREMEKKLMLDDLLTGRLALSQLGFEERKCVVQMVDAQLERVHRILTELRHADVATDTLPTSVRVPVPAAPSFGPSSEIVQSQDWTWPASSSDDFAQLSDFSLPDIAIIQDGQLCDIVGTSSEVYSPAGSRERLAELLFADVATGTVPTSVPVHVHVSAAPSFGPLSEIVQSQDWTWPASSSDEFAQLSDFSVQDIAIIQDGQWCDIVGPLSEVCSPAGSREERIVQVGRKCSNGSQQEFIDMDELFFDSLGLIGDLDSIESVDPVRPGENVLESEPLLDSSELVEWFGSNMEVDDLLGGNEYDGCDDWRENLSFADF